MCFQRSERIDKLYKTVLATVTAASVLVCSACAGAPAADQVQDPDAGKKLPEMTEKITIPASIFKFANTDIEDTWRLLKITVPM